MPFDKSKNKQKGFRPKTNNLVSFSFCSTEYKIIFLTAFCFPSSDLVSLISVSYTHLDVYKRQGIYRVSYEEWDILQECILLAEIRKKFHINIGPETLCFRFMVCE